MTSLYPALALGAVALVAVIARSRSQAKLRAVRAKLRAEWVRPRSAARDLLLIASYSRALPQPACGQPTIIDDRTWQDLDLGAASAALAYLVSGPARCLVIAATHDLEFVSLLAPDYVVVHFADEMRDGGLHFDYLLRPGPTTTRNAIALLGVLGAPPEVVAEALARTERLRGNQRKPS